MKYMHLFVSRVIRYRKNEKHRRISAEREIFASYMLMPVNYITAFVIEKELYVHTCKTYNMIGQQMSLHCHF